LFYGFPPLPSLQASLEVKLLGRVHTKEPGNRNAITISEICYQPELNTLLNGAAQIEETATHLQKD
jgi:hypothetical protein